MVAPYFFLLVTFVHYTFHTSINENLGNTVFYLFSWILQRRLEYFSLVLRAHSLLHCFKNWFNRCFGKPEMAGTSLNVSVCKIGKTMPQWDEASLRLGIFALAKLFQGRNWREQELGPGQQEQELGSGFHWRNWKNKNMFEALVYTWGRQTMASQFTRPANLIYSSINRIARHRIPV